MKQFINISNHPSNKWSEEQLNAARHFRIDGEDNDIQDIAFPNVSAYATSEGVAKLADEFIADYIDNGSRIPGVDIILLQGEMTLVYAMVSRLKKLGYTVVAACSERQSVETVDSDGNTVKRAVFHFVQFREY